MPSFNSLAGKKVSDVDLPEEYASSTKQTNLLAKVFGVMFISLLSTSILSYGFAFLFSLFYNSGNDNAVMTMTIIMIGSLLGICVMAFVLPAVFVRGKHSLLPSYIIYLSLMSIAISSIYLAYNFSTIIFAFAITAITFGVMSILGYLFKGSTKGIVIVIIGGLIGASILALYNLFVGSNEIDWIVSFIILAIILFVTINDVTNIKNTIYNGSENSYNIVLYSAITLYMDFINIFLRILYYVAILKSDNKSK